VRLEKLVDLAAVAVPCPYCDAELRPVSVRVAGLAIVVDANCPRCGGEFAFDWPAGHSLSHPALVDRKSGAVHADGSGWYARRFAHCIDSEETPLSAEITVSGSCRSGHEAILVNCLDFLYSHVLLKLMSAPRHMRESPDDDIVVIVPKLLRWLVPRGVLVIEVDLPLRDGGEWVAGLDARVEAVVAPAKTVRISPAMSQPEVTARDLAELGEDLTPSSDKHDDSMPLQIGFCLRTDRLWLGHLPFWIRAARRLLPARHTHTLLLRRQRHNYALLARHVRDRHPDARFVALGIGEPQGLPDYIDDLRTPGAIREESHWLDEYRRCRVVVGIHGANLLLPSLLAGAVVDLLPTRFLRNINQDLIIPRESASEPKLLLFSHRIVPQECTPETVAAITTSVIEDANWHQRNMIDNRRAYNTPGWLRPIKWRPVRDPRLGERPLT
jgi:hypothetical protein